MTECYECAKLAELRAENSALRVRVDGLTCNDALAPEKVVTQETVDANDGFMDLDSCTHGMRTFASETDSREKLEADVNKFVINNLERGLLTYGAIIRLLDRQAAITEREFIEVECMKCAKADKERESDYSEALAERDDVIAVLKAENAELQSRHCEWSDPDSLGDGCMLRKDKRVDELTAERDQWREAAGNAHAMWEKADNERIMLAEQLESAHAKNRSLRQHIAKMQEGRHGWHVKGAELQREVDRLTRENISLARDLGECMAERDGLKRESAKLSYDEFYLRCALVDMNGEVVG